MKSNFWTTVFHTNMFIFESYGEDEVEQFSCNFFFTHRLYSHNIQNFVMTVNIFFIFFLSILFQSLKHCYNTCSDFFSSTLAGRGLEVFCISLGFKVRQLACCAGVTVLKSDVFMNPKDYSL